MRRSNAIRFARRGSAPNKSFKPNNNRYAIVVGLILVLEPMWKLIVIPLIALISVDTAATERPEVSWVVESAGRVVIAQVWAPASDKKPYLWRIVSASGAPLSQAQEPPLVAGFTYSYGECLFQGKLASDVIAQIKVRSTSPKAVAVGHAWRFNPATQSFVPAATTGLVCYNADYGL